MAATALLEVGYPLPHTTIAGTPAFTNFALNASTDKIEITFQAREAATITHVGFRYAARTGTPPTYLIDLQSVSTTTGLPGGILGGGTPASATFTPPATTAWDGTWQWIALANSYTCTRGEIMALVIEYSTGTIDGSNNSSFTNQFNFDCRQRWPSTVQVDAGVRSATLNNVAVWGYKSSTTSYGLPLEAVSSTAYSSGSTPDEKGMLFTLPAGWGDTFQIVGVYCGLNAMVTANTCALKLYDTNGSTVLQSIAIDTDQITFGVNLPAGSLVRFFFDETTLSTLTFGSAYRVTLEATSAAVGIGLDIVQVDAANDWTAFPGGTAFQLTTRTDAGAWTEDATQRPMIGLILDDLTEPSGGGGSHASAYIG